MKKKYSYFKKSTDTQLITNWVSKLEKANGYQYKNIIIETSLGKTQVWGLNLDDLSKEVLVIFPGTRTSALFWDLDRGLDVFENKYRIFMIEINGQPNLSDGYSPDIKGLDYGIWAAEVFDKLNIQSAFITGASFGALVCMKLCITNPEKVKAAILLNPACFKFISLSFKNLYANLLPVLVTSPKNVGKFLDMVVFYKPDHKVSEYAEKLILEYELLAIAKYKDKTQKPYNMKNQLEQVETDTYILFADKDIIFPYQKSLYNAKKYLGDSLKKVFILNNAAHGVETLDLAMKKIYKIMKQHSKHNHK